jgi:general secretion pathway protein B
VVLIFAPWRTPAPVPLPALGARVAPAPAPELAPAPREGAPAPLAQGELPPPQPGALDPGARPIEPPIRRGNPPPMAEAHPPQGYPPAQQQRNAAREPPADRVAAGRVATLEPRADARAPTQPPAEHYGAPLPAAPAPVAARANAVPNVNDLEPNVRSQLPRLAVGGAIYSETPSARMVILNGQVFHEGDKPAADTVLEQIRLKSAILNFRGQRYEVSF